MASMRYLPLRAESGDAFERALDVLRRGGQFAYPNGVEPPPNKRRDITVTRTTALPEFCNSRG